MIEKCQQVHNFDIITLERRSEARLSTSHQSFRCMAFHAALPAFFFDARSDSVPDFDNDGSATDDTTDDMGDADAGCCTD